MFVGPALRIQTTFMDKVFVIHLIIVPHPWKYLISIFFFFILGAAALFTTNCKNYMSSAKNYTTSDKVSKYFAEPCTNFSKSSLEFRKCSFKFQMENNHAKTNSFVHNNSSCQDLVPQCTTLQVVLHQHLVVIIPFNRLLT